VAALLVLYALIGNHGSHIGGHSPSYVWGEKAGSLAVTEVNSGVPFELACKSAIELGAMFADDPVLNPTPPPKPFSREDAQQGCLAAAHQRLGY